MRSPLFISTLLLCLSLPAAARQQSTAAKAAPDAKPPAFQTEYFADLDDVQDKILRLAEAIPADKYSWRPDAGVRSVSEVFMHIAGGNYFLTTFVGAKPPADMPQDLEKITDKAAVLAELKKSFTHVRGVAGAVHDADLDKPVTLFGKPSTERHVFNTLLNHLHEHLGQSIAYARVNGIVPPWNR